MASQVKHRRRQRGRAMPRAPGTDGAVGGGGEAEQQGLGLSLAKGAAMPDIIIVAGPNGAGKTTFGNRLLRLLPYRFVYLNADEIERELDPEIGSKGLRELAAARLALRKLQEATDARANVMLETTLAARTYAKRIPTWQQSGYKISLVYLRLPSADHAVERVRRRVALGGHEIPEQVIRRRFELSLEHLQILYKPIVDEWYIWDSVEGDYAPAQAWDSP